MSELNPTTDKLFQLYQRYELVELGEGSDTVKVAMWKPTDEEARQGQMYMLGRVGYWENEDDKVAERVETFMANLPDDKEAIIEQILEQTIAQKISENIDLIDPSAIRMLERDLLAGLTMQDFKDRWGVKPGQSEAALEATHRTKGVNVKRDDLQEFLVHPEDFDRWLNSELSDKVEEVFRTQEAEEYRKQDVKTLKDALGTVNRRTVAMGLAVQDWTRRMCAVMTREHTEDGRKGALLFAYNPKSPNYIGNAAPEIIELLSNRLNTLLAPTKANRVREVADNGNFPNSVESLSDSTSPLQAVVVPPISEITPQT